MTDRKAEFLALLERYALTVARREGAVDYLELRATEALADEQRAELLAFIGEGWIPVSERLPENISNVLILSRGEQLIASYHSKYSLWYVPFVDKPVVTHWMPLPELPEVKE